MNEVLGWAGPTPRNTLPPETGPTRASIGSSIGRSGGRRRPGRLLVECARPTCPGYLSPSNKTVAVRTRRLKGRLKLLGRSLGQVKTAELDMDAVERNRDVVHQREQARRRVSKRGMRTMTSGPGRRCTIRGVMLLCFDLAAQRPPGLATRFPKKKAKSGSCERERRPAWTSDVTSVLSASALRARKSWAVPVPLRQEYAERGSPRQAARRRKQGQPRASSGEPVRRRGAMDQFIVVDQLGAGAFGRALLCRDKSTREFVVIKEIRCADKAARDEARREAELLRKHSHPNVCRLIASFASDEQKRFYLVLEHCDGGDLSQAISKREIRKKTIPRE